MNKADSTSTPKRALITGITGQDGSYLTELLLEKGYEVHGLVRRTSTFNRHNIEHILKEHMPNRVILHYGDMTDTHSLHSIVQAVQPHEVYNLAAQSHVRVSFEVPFYTAHADAVGVLGLLEAVRLACPTARVYQASTSELYSGDESESPQNEKTIFHPKSPYGVAKLYGLHISRIYRESYGMFISNGILFNHESPRRGESFVTRKVVIGVVEIAKGVRETISVGNLDAARDWGYAPEYMEAAWQILQHDTPEDFVIATGEVHTIRELIEYAFSKVDITINWEGEGIHEKGIDAKTGKTLVVIDEYYFRPNEVSYLRGDSSKAQNVLGWKPKTTFVELINLMVEAELKKH